MKRLHRVTALSCLLSAAAITNHASAWTGTKDLISPKTCQARNGRLVLCQIPTSTLAGSTPATAVPLRAVVQVNKVGDCSTPYSPQIALSIPGEPSVKLSYLREPSLTLRHRDGSAIGRVTVQDVPPWTGRISVPTSCRLSLTVLVDEPDVYSKEEAQALIAKMEQDLAKKQAEAQSYDELLQFRDAFTFLEKVAVSYNEELTDELVQDLRVKAQTALPSLTKLSSECSGELDAKDAENLSQLLFALPHLGEPDEWTNPDGSPKTLADAMGPKDAAIYNTVEALVLKNSAIAGTYETKLKQATTEAVTLSYKLNLAKTQLAAWLK